MPELLGVSRATIQRDLRWLRDAGERVDPLPPLPASSHTSPAARARLRAGLTQEQLARRAGVSRDTVRRSEAGRCPHPDSAHRIATALDCDVRALWPDTPPPDSVVEPAEPYPDAPIWKRRAAVAALYANLGPTAIAARLAISRDTVYRDIAALRAAGWTLPPRPMGRPPRGVPGHRDLRGEVSRSRPVSLAGVASRRGGGAARTRGVGLA